MEVITLQGAHNSGKTSTLRQLDVLLSAPNSGFQEVQGTRQVRSRTAAVFDIMVLHQAQNGKIIGLTTRGDLWDLIRADIAQLHQMANQQLGQNCDIIVCACLTRGATINYLNNTYPGHLHITQRVRILDTQQVIQADHQRVAQLLLADINRYI